MQIKTILLLVFLIMCSNTFAKKTKMSKNLNQKNKMESEKVNNAIKKMENRETDWEDVFGGCL